jgi:hypothetical protein
MLRRLAAELLDRAEYLLTLARLTVLDWLAPLPESSTDRAIREEGERLRKAFPFLDERRRPTSGGEAGFASGHDPQPFP